ncbi:MAG: methyltransferase type 11 [Cohnella sp.]|jgi:SAM-dependent methyltransferase|nr:methyltransferase type 11 [Cohnella sp.]
MDLLSRLGVASAHPGGFRATKKLMEKALQPSDLRILEVGCGTGKSACYLAKQGFRVTALDQHPLMLQKARRRAQQEGIEGVNWVEGNIESLPFPNEAFDVVFAESVTIFTDFPKALEEYHRVLKPGGRLLDREMVLFAEIPEPIYTEIKDYFGIAKIHSVDEWLQNLRQAGFQCDRPAMEPFWSHEQSVEGSEIRELDLTLLMDPEIGHGLLKYSELMLAQEPYFRACDFEAYKE